MSQYIFVFLFYSECIYYSYYSSDIADCRNLHTHNIPIIQYITQYIVHGPRKVHNLCDIMHLFLINKRMYYLRL